MMKGLKLICIAGLFIMSSANSQTNQLLGLFQSAREVASQVVQNPSQPATGSSWQDAQGRLAGATAARLAAQQQAVQQSRAQDDARRAAFEQKKRQEELESDRQQAIEDAADKKKYNDSVQRDETQAAQQRVIAGQVAAACPTLNNQNMNLTERFIRCRNSGMTEGQEMAFLGGLPMIIQAYGTAMVQDVYEANITNPAKGKEVTDYYDACYRRGTPCLRPKW